MSGITGFIGNNLNAYLQNKYIVNGVSRQKSRERNIISYEALTVESLNGFYSFIHLAGKAHDLKKTASNNEYYEINTELTKKLFDKFLKSESKIFIFMSSVKAVADKVETVLTEQTTPNPQTPYGISKRAAEAYILSKKLSKNKRVYILRPCMVHGPNNKGNLNLLYKIIQNNIPYPLGAFENKRSFLSVKNLCYVVDKLIESKPESGIYNLADDKSISTNSLVEHIGCSIDKKVIIIKVPISIIRLIARCGDYLHLSLNTEKLVKLTENYVVSNNKIKQVLNIEMPLSIEQGITQTIKSFDNENRD